MGVITVKRKAKKSIKRPAPNDAALEQMAKMPDNVKKIAVAYAYGVMMAEKAAAARETR